MKKPPPVNWKRLAILLRRAVKAREDQLACYRFGKPPSASLHERIRGAKWACAEFDRIIKREPKGQGSKRPPAPSSPP